eukprot:COSAG01_NODE_48697_length_378_cov_87.243728_1_plen_39_part_10
MVQPTLEDAPIYDTTILQPYGPALTELRVDRRSSRCWMR